MELPDDEALALKHVGATNIEQYNKLSSKCAYVCSLYISEAQCYYSLIKRIIRLYYGLYNPHSYLLRGHQD
jgi:hypothetical protein